MSLPKKKQQTIQLFDVPRTEKGTWVRIVQPTSGPPAGLAFDEDDLILYFHTDGMYSYCKDQAGRVCHLKAWAEVEVIGEET
jgi:hypothetical protein